MKLWYGTPGKQWIDCLPAGNGNLGFMMDGGVKQEQIFLNDDTLWSGYPKKHLNPGSLQHLGQIRELLFAGKAPEADQLIKKTSLGDWSEAYEPLGKLTLRYQNMDSVSQYKRWLDLDNGLCKSSFSQGDNRVEKEAFCSYPHQTGVIKIKTKHPISLSLTLNSRLRSAVCVQNGCLLVSGNAPDTSVPNYCHFELYPIRYNEHKAMSFCGGVKPVTDGKVVYGKHKITIHDAKEICIYVASATGFRGFDQMPDTSHAGVQGKVLKKLSRTFVYQDILQAHVKDYQKLYGRVSFQLQGAEKTPPGDQLIAMAKQGKIHPALPVIYYQYARYMTIAGSREGTQPLTLQGIWNRQMRPPWSSNYTNNINAQMNYWFTAGANLRECLEPYEMYLSQMMATGAQSAKVNYGCRGFSASSNADIWRKTTPVKRDPVYAYFPLGAQWLANELYSQTQYEDDQEKLQRIFPVLREAALFCVDWLTEHEGKLVCCPSASPEVHYKQNGKSCAMDYGTAFDMSIIWQTLRNYEAAVQVLGQDNDSLLDQVRTAFSRLAPLQFDESGLLEWSKAYEITEKGHRHFSPLYGLYPGDRIYTAEDKTLTDAAGKLLAYRMRNGSGQTGWSAAWAACLFARLADGAGAYDCLKKLWANSTHQNLFDKHPPYYFQIDGNFGGAAAIQEMLYQYKNGVLMLLPALPKEWPDGSLNGVLLPKGITLCLSWQNGQLTKASITAPADTQIKAAYNGIIQNITLAAKQTIHIEKERFE